MGMDTYVPGHITGLAEEELPYRIMNAHDERDLNDQLIPTLHRSSPLLRRSGNQGPERAIDLPRVTRLICPGHPTF